MATLYQDINGRVPAADPILTSVTDRSARGLAAAIGRLVSGGELAAGTRLPTVRALARELGVSPTTVGEAWRRLGDQGLVESRGRLGTFVVGAARSDGPRRFRRVSAPGSSSIDLDLSTGVPDPDLLPAIAPILARVSRSVRTTSYLEAPVLPELRDALVAVWPFPPEELTVVDGAMDALERLCSVTIRYGDRVLVEDPGFPPLFDLLDALGAEVVPVALDDEGIVAGSLERALAVEPVAVFVQPRAHNPAGVAVSARRVAALAKVLRRSTALVIEDDHAGDIARSPLASIGVHLPERTVLVRSFSKSHGPDLRLAAVGGAGEPIAALMRRRLLGVGWSSRLLQQVLLAMLEDRETVEQVAAARQAYADRRDRLTSALGERGVASWGYDGINLWVEVADELNAQLDLAAAGIGVAPGRPFMIGASPRQHLRITSGLVRDRFAEIADRIAHAARTRAAWGRGT